MSQAQAAAIEILAATGDPYPHYAALREHAPVFALAPHRIFVTSFAEGDAVLRSPVFRSRDKASADREWPGWQKHASARAAYETMLFANPPEHSALRRPYAQQARNFESYLAEEASAALDVLAARGSAADFMADFALLFPARMVLRLVGLSTLDPRWWAERLFTFSHIFEHAGPGSDLTALDRAAEELLARARAELPTAGGNLIFVLSAGVDTTANLLGNAVHRLLEHPAEMAQLRENPALIAAYIKEVLRYETPLQLTSRVASTATELGGTTIRPGAVVMVFAGSANRDEARYHCGDDFNPSREPLPPLSFGAGPHYCIGAGLAQREAEVALALILQRFPRLALAGPATRHTGMLLRGFTTLPISW